MSTDHRLTVFAPEGEQPDPKALEQIKMVLDDEHAVRGALMADHHLGYSMPIGGVVVYDGAISPSGVGFDIACGNKAVQTMLSVDDLVDGNGHQAAGGLSKIMEEIEQRVAFGMGRSNQTPIDHPLFDKHDATLRELDKLAGKNKQLSQKARAQLGTVGAGNHYVDLLADETGAVWIANHFGSRGLGHTIATGFLNLADGEPFDHRGRERDGATVIATDTELGQAYIAAMELAGDYAYAGRDYVIDQVLDILGARGSVVLEVHNHHNYAWLHEGMWVVRKGATPLTRELAYIGGSMGDGAVIVRGAPRIVSASHPIGKDLPDISPDDWAGIAGVSDIGALGSAPHGAGRVMSRTRAAGKTKRVTFFGCTVRDCPHEVTAKAWSDSGGTLTCPTHTRHRMRRFTRFEQKSVGVVDWPRVQWDLAEAGIVLRGGGADEAPEVYKNLDAVIAAHSNIEVVHRLRTLGVVMAGPDVFDPYKD